MAHLKGFIRRFENTRQATPLVCVCCVSLRTSPEHRMAMSFGACFGARSRATEQRRRRIDRSMIGMPTDFKHTGHIGSGDMASGSDLGSIQGQMQSKGGYQGISVPVACTPAGIPVGGGN